MDKFVAEDKIRAAISAGVLNTVNEAGVIYVLRDATFLAWSDDTATGSSPSDDRRARTWTQAVELAAKRRLERLTLKAQKPDDARSLLGLALPLNAPTLTATANVSGQVKEGGSVNFAVTNV